MKNIIFMVAAFVAASNSLAAEVLSAKIDASNENIEVTVKYSGGCFKHDFKLQVSGCLESYPVQCSAEVVDVTKTLDVCEAIVSQKVVFNLKAHGLTDSYYANGSLSLSGDNKSMASVIIPDASKNAVKDNLITCVTHTGSVLKINETQKSVGLVTSAGQVANYVVVNTQYLSIETYPTIDQTTYKLDDGRSIRTEFTDGQSSGIGHYIRLTGEFSPEFNCTK